jgi:hypothetical protein
MYNRRPRCAATLELNPSNQRAKKDTPETALACNCTVKHNFVVSSNDFQHSTQDRAKV